MKNNLVLLFLAAFILITSCGTGSALTETRLSTNSADQTHPSLWGNYIVWQDARNGGSDVYLTDMSKKVQTRVTANVVAENPVVSGTKIVWQDKRNGNWDIYMYEISTKKTTRITTNKSDQINPGVYGNYIVWEDARHGGSNIYLMDLATKKETRLTTNGASYKPSIYGTKIAYSREDSSLQLDFGDTVGAFLYDIKTKKVIQLSNNIFDWPASIYGNTVLINGYYDYPYSYVQDFVKGTFVDLPYMNDGYSSIYSNKVVYSDYRDGNVDIYMAQY